MGAKDYIHNNKIFVWVGYSLDVPEGTHTFFFYIHIVQLGTNVNFSLKQEWGK